MSDIGESTFLAAELGRGVDVTAVTSGLANHIPALLKYLGDSLSQSVRNRCCQDSNPNDAAERIAACAFPKRNSESQRATGPFIQQRSDTADAPANLLAARPPVGPLHDTNHACGNFSKPAIFHGWWKPFDDCLGLLLSHQEIQSSLKGYVIVVRGVRGIEKTTAAQAVLAHRGVERAFSRLRFFVACGVVGSIDALESRLLATFDLSGAGCSSEAARPPRSSGATGQHAKKANLEPIKDCRRTAPALVVLDNFETVWNVWNGTSGRRAIEQYIEELATTCSLILTIRGAPPPKLECNSLDLCQGPLHAQDRLAIGNCLGFGDLAIQKGRYDEGRG